MTSRPRFPLASLLALALLAHTAHAYRSRLQEQARPWASAPAQTLEDGTEVQETVLPKATSARTDWVPVGTTRLDLQSNGSLSRMIAVSADGMVHGVYTGGENPSLGRRAMAWCVDPQDMAVFGPAAITETLSGYPTLGVTGAAPGNGLAPLSGVAGFNSSSPAGSALAVDFGGCTLAFTTLIHPGAPLWPHVAVDGQDRLHLVVRGSPAGDDPYAVYYDASTDGTTWDTGYQLVSGNCRVPGAVVVANTHSNRAALLFLEKTSPLDVPFDGPPEENGIGSQLHNDLMAFLADDGDLAEEIEAGNLINLTTFGHTDTASPFGPYGCRAYADVDGLFDLTATENLHLVFSACVMFTDTLVVYDEDGNGTPLIYYNWNLGRGQIWHNNLDTGEWSHVAGYNSVLTEQEDEFALPQGWRMFIDRPTIAVDPLTGYLYTVWSEYSRADTSAAGFYNGEIMARCSADNGLTWGPKINLTDTQAPGCECANCPAEDWPCVAALASGGFLHLTFIDDRDAGAMPRNEGCETVNDVIYHQVPVTDVPPHTGEPWNAEGHVGLVSDRRWYRWECSAWTGDSAYLDSTRWLEPVHVFNESPYDIQVSNMALYHHPMDPLGSPEQRGLVDLDLEVLQDEAWIPWWQWDGWLPRWRATKFRVHVAYSGLPTFDQLLVFRINGHPDLVYRVDYQAWDDSLCTGVLRLDRNNLHEYSNALFIGSSESGFAPGFQLEPNWPNPFNPVTTLAFTLEHNGPARLTVHNLLGETVATLVDGPVAAGRHTVTFDASGLASGVYLYTLEAAGRSESRKLVVLK